MILLIAAENCKRVADGCTSQLIAGDRDTLADGDGMMLCDDEQIRAERFAVYVFKGGFTEQDEAAGNKFKAGAALAVVHTAVNAGQRDGAGVVNAVDKVAGLRVSTCDDNCAVLAEI